MLHLKDGVFAEVDKALHLLLVATVADGGVEERLLRLLDLRLLPLVQLVLVDLEVDALNLVSRLDLDPAQEGLEVVENRASRLQESVGEEKKLIFRVCSQILDVSLHQEIHDSWLT